ncbi:MAG TPA: hypothetical protein VE781_12115, partial [Kineosporiaceae bacterium]|nr:hypothetical protein [Kineosporiaceae bacterium]
AGRTTGLVGTVELRIADAPGLVVAVVFDQPSKGSHFGGDVAAPVFRDLMAFALRQAKIPPTGTTAPRVPLRWN